MIKHFPYLLFRTNCASIWDLPAVMGSPERDTDLFDGLPQVMAAGMGTIITDTAHLDLGYQVHLCCFTVGVLFHHHGEPLIVNPDVCYTGCRDGCQNLIYSYSKFKFNQSVLTVKIYEHAYV